jgi:hypothetical protein
VSAGAETADYEVAAWVLGEVRKAKALAKRSLRTTAERVVVARHAGAAEAAAGRRTRRREAGSVAAFEVVEADEPSVEVELTPPD